MIISESRHVEVLFNWYSIGREGYPRTTYRERLGLQNQVVLFFAGNFGVAQDPLNVLRLASSLRSEPHISFLLVGWGSKLVEMRKVILQQDLHNVILLDTVPQEDFILRWHVCDPHHAAPSNTTRTRCSLSVGLDQRITVITTAIHYLVQATVSNRSFPMRTSPALSPPRMSTDMQECSI